MRVVALGAEPTADVPLWLLLAVKIGARRGVSIGYLRGVAPIASHSIRAMELCRFHRPLALLGTFFAGRRL
jgi:hypothetical protein